MGEPTALKKSPGAPGPLVEPDEDTRELIDPRGDNTALRFLARIGFWLAVFAAYYAYYRFVGAALIGPIVAGLVGLAAWPVWQMTRLIRRAQALNRQAELGELDAVIAQHRAIVLRTHDAYRRGLMVHDLGYYELLRGNIDRALALLSAAYREMRSRHDRPTVSRNLSIAYLARGDVEAAAAWVPNDEGPGLHTPHAAAAVRARRGEWDEVLALEWPHVRPRLAYTVRHARRLFFLLRAYARERRGDPDSAVLADELEAARPAYAGEYDYLTGQWPELRAFVADRCLPPRSAPDAVGLPRARVVEKR